MEPGHHETQYSKARSLRRVSSTLGWVLGCESADFGDGVLMSEAGSFGIMAIKLHDDGNQIWSQHLGPADGAIYGISTASSGELYTVGRYVLIKNGP